MKIAVITDVHANLPALSAALKSIHAEGVDAIYHTGDVIAIGPQPAECVELLLNAPAVRFVAGNHESYFTADLPKPQPTRMSDGEVEHQRWSDLRLGPRLRSVLATWPYMVEAKFDGVKTVHLHYALDPSQQSLRPVL